MDGPAIDYLRWFYDQKIWKGIYYRGVRTLKFPMDLWNYQEIISERGIDWIVETGTRHGGSALFFGDLLGVLGRSGKVVTIDNAPELGFDISGHPKIVMVVGDSASPLLVDRLYASLPADRGPLFLILDSDHSMTHVLAELTAHIPRLRSGDYVVVEDTIINGHPVRPDFGPGPMEAIEHFQRNFPGLLVPDHARCSKFGCSQADNGYFVRL